MYRATCTNCNRVFFPLAYPALVAKCENSDFSHCAFEFIEQEVAPPAPEPVCKHLGGDTNEVVLIRCQTCRGNVRLKFAVHGCALFGKCLPKYSGEVEEGHGCIGCDKRESTTSPDS